MSSIRAELLDIIMNIESLDKEAIVDKLKKIIIKKDSIIKTSFEEQSTFEERIIEQATKSRACCMPSICISNCDDCRPNIEINADATVSMT